MYVFIEGHIYMYVFIEGHIYMYVFIEGHISIHICPMYVYDSCMMGPYTYCNCRLVIFTFPLPCKQYRSYLRGQPTRPN